MDVQRLLFHWRKLFWLSAAAVTLFTVDAALTTYGPPRVVTVILREWQRAGMPAVATAASFSVSAGSFTTETRAASFAAALDASAMPILVRVRPDDGRYQVLVGPYVSTEEAEHAQRALAAWGLGESRFVVDDTMRAPSTASVFGDGEHSNGVVLVAAPGVLSVVFEMMHAPRDVEAKRTSATTIEVAIGGQQPAVSGQQAAGSGQPDDFEALALPDGVSLVRDVSVQSAGDEGSLRAHLVVPGDAQSRVRLEGKRVYLDLAWPKAPWAITGAGMAGGAGRAGGAGKGASRATAEATAIETGPAGHGDLAAAEARFHEIEPFLASAKDSDADVRAALRRSLEGLRSSVEQLPPSNERAALLADIDMATP